MNSFPTARAVILLAKVFLFFIYLEIRLECIAILYLSFIYDLSKVKVYIWSYDSEYTDRAAYLTASRQSNHLEVGLELMLVLTAAELSAGSAAPLHSNYKSILVRIILEISACGRAVRVIFILKHFRISKRKMEKREIAILLTGLFFYVT